MCKRIFKDQTTLKGEIPFFKIGTLGSKADAFISRELFEEYKSKYPYPSKGSILISASGSIGRTVVYTGKSEYFQDSNIVWLKHDEKLQDSFLKYLYETINWAGVEGSTIKRLYNENILKTQVIIPSPIEHKKISKFFSLTDERIETQSKIINSIQSQINSINHVMINRSKELIPLHEICTFEFKTNRKSNDGLPNGKYPFFTNEEEQTQYLNEYDFDGQYIIANTGGKANFRYFNGKFASMSDCLVIKIINTDLTYFYSNVLKDKKSYINYVGFEGSGLKHLNKEWLLNFLVPKYNSSIQNYITIIKNIMNKLKIEKNILELYKKQKAYLLQNMFI